MRKILLSRSGRLLGWLIDLTKDQKAIFNRQGQMLGWYNPKTNQTISPRTGLVGFGDLRASLLASK